MALDLASGKKRKIHLKLAGKFKNKQMNTHVPGSRGA